jgi:TRAP-type mannitol/chloroaromatic compound transport system permease small subunit
MRATLDRLYLVSGWLAALCLVVIAAMVGVQLLGRIADAIMRLAGSRPYGLLVEGLAEIAGYLLAASSLLALANTLKAGAHIRVTMLLSALGTRARWLFELGAFATAFVFSAYMAWRVGALALDSWRFNEVSHGLVPLPLAYPQAAMMVGLIVFSIALLDELLTVAMRGGPSFATAEDAVTLGKEG